MSEHNHIEDDEREEGHDHGDIEEALEEALELDTQSKIFLEMRNQNIELLKIATGLAGYSAPHSPLKSSDLRQALKMIWEIYAEFYAWVDPEESDEDEDEDEEDEDL